jgi:hypothetical protein
MLFVLSYLSQKKKSPGVRFLLDLNIVIGIILTVMALGTVVILTLWSRRIIERIHARSPGSLREIQKDIINGDRA